MAKLNRREFVGALSVMAVAPSLAPVSAPAAPVSFAPFVHKWTGAKSRHWGDPANWVDGLVPTDGSHVEIPSKSVCLMLPQDEGIHLASLHLGKMVDFGLARRVTTSVIRYPFEAFKNLCKLNSCFVRLDKIEAEDRPFEEPVLLSTDLSCDAFFVPFWTRRGLARVNPQFVFSALYQRVANVRRSFEALPGESEKEFPHVSDFLRCALFTEENSLLGSAVFDRHSSVEEEKHGT